MTLNSNNTRVSREDIAIAGADLSGAWVGAKWGWKHGKGIVGKVALSIASAAFLGVISSFCAMYGLELFPYNVLKYDYLYPYNMSVLSEKTLNAVVASYLHRTGKDAWFDCNLDNLEFIDYSVLHPQYNINFTLYDDETQEYVEMSTYLIASIHNDAVKTIVDNKVPIIINDSMLQELDLDKLNINNLSNNIDKLDNCFKTYGNDWIWRSDIQLEEPINFGSLPDNDSESISETTIRLFTDGIKNVSTTSGIGDRQIKEFVEAYIDNINETDFIVDAEKALMISTIFVSSFSYQYWFNQSGIIRPI